MNTSTEDIWNGCGRGLKAFIAHRVSNPDNVDDILQEVFLKVHSKIDSLKDETKICSWVYQVAQNTIIDYYRKHKPVKIDIDKLHLHNETDEDNQYHEEVLDNSYSSLVTEMKEKDPHQEIAAGLKGMVEALPVKYSQALLLVEFEGMSQVEMANKLGISVSGAKSRVQRGRQMLKDMLMDCCHFEFDKYGTIIDSHPKTCCGCNN
jgi:RNA polymerase sigma-70 factor (ECF subfamily)